MANRNAVLIRFAVAAAGVAAVIVVIMMANTRHLGFLRHVYDFPYGDKIGHVTIFGSLTVVLIAAFISVAPVARQRQVVATVSLALAALITLEELSQVWISSRSADLFDLLASYAGVGLGAYAATWLHERRARRRTTVSG